MAGNCSVHIGTEVQSSALFKTLLDRKKKKSSHILAECWCPDRFRVADHTPPALLLSICCSATAILGCIRASFQQLLTLGSPPPVGVADSLLCAFCFYETLDRFTSSGVEGKRRRETRAFLCWRRNTEECDTAASCVRCLVTFGHVPLELKEHRFHNCPLWHHKEVSFLTCWATRTSENLEKKRFLQNTWAFKGPSTLSNGFFALLHLLLLLFLAPLIRAVVHHQGSL